MATDGVTGSSGTNWLENSNYKPSKQTGTDALANKDTFLKLLVAQIRNQNPLNPQDGVQFLSQLAQFSDLEQSVSIREDLSAIRGILEAQNKAATGKTDSGSGQSGTDKTKES